MLGFGAVGFWDDYLKTVRGKNQGLTALQKVIAQAVVALGIGVLFYSLPAYSTKLSVPFFKAFSPDIRLFYIPFAILAIVVASIAVNLTHVLEGLPLDPDL